MKNEKKEKIWFGIIVAFSTAIITKLTNSAINNSPVASSLLSEWSIYVFPGAIVILVVSFLIYITMVNDSWRKAYKRLSSKIESIGTSVSYSEKDGVFGKDRHSVPFYDAELSPLVHAEKELLVFTDSSIKTTTGGKREKARREKFLKAVEENIRNKASSGFKYVRITQYPDGTTTPQSSKLTRDHWKRLLLIKEQYSQTENVEIEIMKVDMKRSFSFMIIDNKILEFEVVGYDYNHKTNETIKYVLGYFTFTDSSGVMIRKFKKFFEKMEKQASIIAEEDLTYVAENPEDKR